MDGFEQMKQSLMRLLAIKSVQDAPCPLSPFGEGVGKALSFFEETARSLGYDTHNEEGYYVTADMGEGEPFAVLGHLDTVPFGEGWTHSPLGEIKGGVIYGRGVMDDKGPLLCCLFAAAELKAQGFVPCRRIRFFAGGNEESGWKCAERYAQKDVWPKEGFSPDADFPVISCEKGVLHLRLELPLPEHLLSIRGGERVNVVMDSCRALTDVPVSSSEISTQKVDGGYLLTASGKPAHGSTPQLGENAAHKILRALAGVSPELSRLEKLCTLDGSGLDCALCDKVSGALTCNLGVLLARGDELFAELDIRYPVTFTAREIAMRIEKALPCRVSVTGEHAPHFVSEDSPLIKALLGAYEQVTKKSGRPLVIGGATFARVIPGAVGFGPCFPGEPSTIHQKDEGVSEEKLHAIYLIYREALKRTCFKMRAMC